MEKSLPLAAGNPQLVVEVDGSLDIRGWEQSAVSAGSPAADDLVLEERNGEVFLRSQGNCSARVPYGASLRVRSASGHVTVNSLEGTLEIEHVAGHLTLRSVAEAAVIRVDGHVSARNIGGSLRLGKIAGNVVVRDLQGDFSTEEVGGNLTLEELDGEARLQVSGSAHLNLDPMPGQRYACSAGGNLVCRLPQGADARVLIERATSVQVKIPGQVINSMPAPAEVELGDGGAEIVLQAGGNVMLGEQAPGFGFESLSDSIDQRIRAQMEQFEQQMEDLAEMVSVSGMPPEQADRLRRHTLKASERARRRAQEKARRAQEKMQRKMETANRRADMKTQAAEQAARDRRRRPETPQSGAAPGRYSQAEPVEEQERLVVLKMLQDGKITVEQAEQLLAALEGRST